MSTSGWLSKTLELRSELRFDFLEVRLGVGALYRVWVTLLEEGLLALVVDTRSFSQIKNFLEVSWSLTT